MRTLGKKYGFMFVLTALLEIAAFGLLAIAGAGTVDYEALIVLVLSLCLLSFQYWILPRIYRGVDRQVIVIVNVLMALGLIFQYRLNNGMVYKQVICCVIGMAAMLITMQLILRDVFVRKYAPLYMLFGVAAVSVTLVLGRVIGGAQNWITLGSNLSVQPSEFAKVALIIILALWLRENRSLRQLIPLFVYIFVCVCLLVVARDLGAAVLYFLTFLVMLFVATSRFSYLAAGTGALAAGAMIAYYLFDHVRTRVHVWLNPWNQYHSGGYQIVQGLMAIVSGGTFGTGIGMGNPRTIPAYRTDYVFAAICEEMGIIAGILVIGFYVILVVRGAIIARRANSAYHALLALGSTVMIALQSFIIIGGVIKLIPLTGITLPLISYGGSSMVVTFMMIGILQAVAEASARKAASGLDLNQEQDES